MLFSPFRGSLFDPDKITDLASATCPPYDVINEAAARRYRTASDHNMVRLLLAGPDDPTYREAAHLLGSWRSDGTVRTDPTERFYLYRMRYSDDTGTEQSAGGIIGALALLPFGDKILPHEQTMPKTKADRLAVLSATRANLDLIIALTPSDHFARLLNAPGDPRLEFETESVRHSLFDITDPDAINAISSAVEDHPVAIADGHHRYTTGLTYQDLQSGRGSWNSIMTFLVPARGSGLTVGPTHRVFSQVSIDRDRLAGLFTMEPCSAIPPNTPGTIVLVPGSGHGSGPLRLRARPEALEPLAPPLQLASPAVGRDLLYPLLSVDESVATYFADADEALQAASTQPGGAVALMARVSEEAISAATEAGLRFPQKSTFFVPKPRSGLVIRSFDDG